MTILFTEEEKRYLETTSGEYGLKAADNAPESIKESINKKIQAHKEWLKGR